MLLRCLRRLSKTLVLPGGALSTYWSYDIIIMLRQLTIEEFDLIKELGFNPPDPNYGIVIGSFDSDDKLDGFVVVQFLAHMEPMWVREDKRATLTPGKLISAAIECAEPLLCSTSDMKVAKMLTNLGFKIDGYALVRENNGEQTDAKGTADNVPRRDALQGVGREG